MENYKSTARHRKASCPLILIDQTNKKFKIYDKEFSSKKGSSDKMMAPPPPEMYPFNDLEEQIESA